jgi:hypothetical protein
MNAMQKSVTLAGALALALTLGGCGSNGETNCTENPLGPGCPPSPSPSPTPAQPVVIYGDSGGVPADTAVAIDFAIPSAGTVAATVDWTFASSDVWVAMTTTACDDFIEAFLGQCAHIGTPNLGNSKPKTVTGSVTQATAGRLWIANFATVDESMAVQIVHTRTGSASVPLTLDPLARNWTPVQSSAMRALRAFEK